MQLRTLDRSRQRRRPGFTLMEVLVVVAILVVLASIGIGVFFYLDTAKERTARIQIANIDTAVNGYRALNGQYPDTLDELTAPQGDKPAALEPQHLIDPWNRKYIYDPSQVHPSTQKPKIYSQGVNPNNPSGYISNW